MRYVTKPIERLGRTLGIKKALGIKTVPPRASEVSTSTHRPEPVQDRLGLWWTFAAALVLAGAIIVAIVQNGRQVRLHYLVWHANVSLIVVVLSTALIAVFLDEVGGLVWRRRRRARLGRRSELEQLRTQQHRPDEASAVAEPPIAHAEVGAQISTPVGPDI